MGSTRKTKKPKGALRAKSARTSRPGDLPDLTAKAVDIINKSIMGSTLPFAEAYLHKQMLSKFVDESQSLDARQRRVSAMKKFLMAEQSCSEVNELFTSGAYFLMSTYPIIDRARVLIEKVLGSFDFVSALGSVALTGGASDIAPRRRGLPSDKLHPISGTFGATSGVREFFEKLMIESPVYTRGIRSAAGCVISFVPKNNSIDRVIAKEPEANQLFQRAIGLQIRSKLRHVGIDLRTQKINQEFARLGSITGEYATIDLSAASDSISIELVREMLPHDWFTLIDFCRSKVATVNVDTDGLQELFGEKPSETIRLEKISSMGNGFTFELETLIFWAIGKACAQSLGSRKRVVCYGDDIICGSEVVALLSYVLGCFGFTVNMDKSFWDGPFRESCGKHYYNGNDVSPFFIRRPITSVNDMYLLINNFCHWSIRCYVGSGRPLLRGWKLLCNLLPARFRLFGSDDGAHSAISVPFEFAVRNNKLKPGPLCGEYRANEANKAPLKDGIWFYRFKRFGPVECRQKAPVFDQGGYADWFNQRGLFVDGSLLRFDRYGFYEASIGVSRRKELSPRFTVAKSEWWISPFDACWIA